ncbi:hypothetical protein HK096_010328, partial [Nowakowskiella sp. JEL0078]
MPTTFVGFKNHPLYALERHLLAREAIYPTGIRAELGKFKGEPVYPRANVVPLCTARDWEKRGFEVLAGSEPVKIEKKRKFGGKGKGKVDNSAMEIDDENDGVAHLFGQWQVKDYIAPELVDGKIPKNEFGNINLFHPRMLPVGSRHLTEQSTLKKAARALGVDFAVAV